MKRNFLPALCALLLLTCRVAPPWSPQERENIQHFIAAQTANMNAIRILNRGPAFSTFSAHEMAQYLASQQQALAAAQLLRDDVLAKAHPDMPAHFRGEFQRSLELDIESVEASPSSAKALSIEAASLHEAWVDWYNAHKGEIKIPSARTNAS